MVVYSVYMHTLSLYYYYGLHCKSTRNVATCSTLERGYGTLQCIVLWLPIESSDLDIDECLSIDYPPKEGEPGFEVETKDESFWLPVAYRTRTRSKV